MGFGDKVEVLIFLSRVPRLEQPLNADTFRLGCAPVINLFNQIAEPIRLDRAQTEYRVIPDVRRQNATEIYAIDSVTSVTPYQPEPVTFQPFYSFKHTAEREHQQAFWYMTRRPSPRKGDAGTDVYLSLVDLNYRPTLPSVETLTLQPPAPTAICRVSCRLDGRPEHAVIFNSNVRRRFCASNA